MRTTGAIHVVHEAKSPPSEMTTTMWCGATTIELFYGAWTPDLDFFYERDADKTTCEPCRRALSAAASR